MSAAWFNVAIAIVAFALMFDEWMRAVPGRPARVALKDEPDGRYR